MAPPVVNPAIAAAMAPTGPTGFPGASGTPQYGQPIAQPGPAGTPPAMSGTAPNGIGDMIKQAIAVLAQKLMPTIAKAPQRLNNQVGQAAGAAPPVSLGNQFGQTGGSPNP